jgi:hypothetical protein
MDVGIKASTESAQMEKQNILLAARSWAAE